MTDDIPQGLHYGLPFDEYLSLKRASKGALHKLITTTPAECLRYINKEPSESDKNEHLKKGTFLHAAILEPDKIGERFVAEPRKYDGRKTEDKKERQKFYEESEAAGREVVTAKTLTEVTAMSTALWGHPMARSVLEHVKDVEVTALWETAGVKCRARADFITANGYVVDIKTTSKISQFEKDVYNYGYDIGWAHYLQGFRACSVDIKGFLFIVVPSDAEVTKELVRCFDPSGSELWSRHALMRYQAAFSKYAHCEKTGVWPGYPQEEFESLTYPGWALKEIERVAQGAL